MSWPPARRGRIWTRTSESNAIDAAVVAELVRGQRHGGDGVERDVEPVAVPERRRHQAAGIEQELELARLLEPVLVCHRATGPLCRRPVDAPDVVVRRPLAHRLEVGSEPERSPSPRAGIEQPPLTRGEREPPRRHEVGVDEQLGGSAPAAVGGAETAAAPRRGSRPPAARGGRDRVAISSPSIASVPSLGVNATPAGVTWRSATAWAAGTAAAIASRTGDPREMICGTRSAHGRLGPHRPGVEGDRGEQDDGRDRDQPEREQRARSARAPRARPRRAGSGSRPSHRGTGTEASALRSPRRCRSARARPPA